MDNYQVILGPVLTEKALKDQEKNCYHLWVHPKATKNQVKVAVMQLFGVKPVAIRTILLKGKRKRVWRQNRLIQKSTRKKAVIQLEEGKKIDLIVLEKKK